MHTINRKRFILLATFGYAAAAALWILGTDALLEAFDREAFIRLATEKGIAFVLVTSGALALVLRSAMARAGDAPLAAPATPVRIWPLIAIIACIAVVMGAIGTLAYLSGSEALKRDKLTELRTIATLKATTISRWLDERSANVRALARDPTMVEAVARWRVRGDAAARANAFGVLSSMRSTYGFSSVELVDENGAALLQQGESMLGGARLIQAIDSALYSGNVTMVDLYRSGEAADVRLAFVAPLARSRGEVNLRPVLVVLELRPDDYLYPTVKSWPRSGSTGSAALVRADWSDLLYLSELPGRPGSALNTRISLSKNNLPAVQFLVGDAGGAEGRDYRGVGVLAAGAAVPGTRWLVLATIERAEALHELRRLAIVTAGLVAVAVAFAAGAVGFFWQRQRLHAALSEVQQRRETAAAELRFQATFDQAPDGLAHIDIEGRWLRINSQLAQITGYSHDELLAMAPGQIAYLSAAETLESCIPRFLAGTADHCSGERRLSRPDGREIWIELTLALVRTPDRKPQFFVLSIADISARAKAAAEQALATAVFTNTREGVVITDPGGSIIGTNPAFCTITGYEQPELIGCNMRMLQSGRQDREFYATFWSSILKSGFWQGEIWNRRKSGEVYPELLTVSTVRDAAGAVRNYVGTFTDITHLKQSQEQLEHLARHDPLTRLPNRLLLLSRLEHAIERMDRHGGVGAILFLDLDRFKIVNDSLGHPAGDELLQGVAQRLSERLRESDTLARIGGDEFVAVLEDLGSAEQAGAVAQTLIERLSEPFQIAGGHEVYVGLSIGISLFPLDGNDAQVLIQEADAALYAAKEGGRGIYRFYRTELTEAAQMRLATEARLRRALEHGDMVVHYQPLVSIARNRIIGVEALVRWQDRVEGLIGPDRFIPLAEESGLIVPLGDWVLGEACRQTQAWRAAGLPLDNVAVNLSSRQFALPDIAERVQKVLAGTGLPPQCLELEITESALMNHGEETLNKLAALKRLGVHLAVDDFGTGYSSLAYLKRFPIDKLKIDKSFVDNIPSNTADMQIASVVIALAKNLGLEALAEGVETPEQLDFLRRRGCDTVQGYLFSKPLPPADLTSLLTQGEAPWCRKQESQPAPRHRAGGGRR